MHKNQIWLAFLASLVLIVLWFTGSTGYDLYLYASQKETASPLSMTWSVQARSADQYYLQADYTFQTNGEVFDGRSSIDEFYYKNVPAAEKVLGDYSRKEWTVWFSPSNPSSSSLQKFFPIKSCVYTLILWGLLLYFIRLGLYVGRTNSQTSV